MRLKVGSYFFCRVKPVEVSNYPSRILRLASRITTAKSIESYLLLYFQNLMHGFLKHKKLDNCGSLIKMITKKTSFGFKCFS